MDTVAHVPEGRTDTTQTCAVSSDERTLAAGSRVLLVADPAAGRLVVHPPAALDAMIGQYHAAVLGGESR
jgi:hypothetical protein